MRYSARDLIKFAIAMLMTVSCWAQGSGVVGYEVFSTSTPGGGGEMQSQGLTGERTAWFTTHIAPGQAGVVNMVVTYYASKEDLEKAKEAEKKKKDDAKKKKSDTGKNGELPNVPTFDPRFYELKDGKVVPREQKKEERQVIQPSSVRSNEAFTFAVVGAVEGELIQIQTVDGEVIQRAKTDNYGRVFLPAGLAAGSYLLTSTQGAHPSGVLEIQSGSRYSAPAAGMHLGETPKAINVDEPLHVSGQGFSPDASNMSINDKPVLAATSQELVPILPAPGIRTLDVRNEETGETVHSDPLLVYRLTGQIERRKLVSGEQTVLRLQFEPANVVAPIEARVVTGPVSFGNGLHSINATIRDGQAVLPVAAKTGSSGPFTLAWALRVDNVNFAGN